MSQPGCQIRQFGFFYFKGQFKQMEGEMNKKIIIAFMCTLFFCANLTTVSASEYLGELCWGEEGNFLAKVALTNMGDDNYLAQVSIFEAQGSLVVGLGNGVIKDNVLVIHASDGASFGSDFWTSAGIVTVDLTTKEMTFEGLINRVWDKFNVQPTEYENSGPWQTVACPTKPKTKGKQLDPLEVLFK